MHARMHMYVMTVICRDWIPWYCSLIWSYCAGPRYLCNYEVPREWRLAG